MQMDDNSDGTLSMDELKKGMEKASRASPKIFVLYPACVPIVSFMILYSVSDFIVSTIFWILSVWCHRHMLSLTCWTASRRCWQSKVFADQITVRTRPHDEDNCTK